MWWLAALSPRPKTLSRPSTLCLPKTLRILVTNDDGIFAPGLLTLATVAAEFGEVVVVAPDRERSCCGHAMTMREPLRVTEVDYPVGRAFAVNGLPVDCVNVGLTVPYPDGCDLILSGVNAGPNLGYDATYSGTVAGAMEGAINGIRSLAFSMAGLRHGEPIRYEISGNWLREQWSWLTTLPISTETFINVNVPNEVSGPHGFRLVPMGQRVYEERVEVREDPWGRPYYWQGGVYVLDREQPGTDFEAVGDGFVSITPMTLDWTDHRVLAKLAERVNSPT
jgi:5'-nucleotidase